MLSPRPQLAKLSDRELLGRLPDLKHFSEEQLQALHGATNFRSVERNDVIPCEDSSLVSNLAILLRGTARVSCSNGGRPKTLLILPPGLMLRLPPMPFEIKYSLVVEALTECRVGFLPLERFFAIVFGAPAPNFSRVIDDWNYRLGALLYRYTSFADLSLDKRVALTLLELCRDFGVRDANGLLLRISPTHEQLADLTGGSRSRVTKALARLEDKGTIVREGRRIHLHTAEVLKLLKGQ